MTSRVVFGELIRDCHGCNQQVRLRNQLPPVKAPAAVSVLLPTAGEIVGKHDDHL